MHGHAASPASEGRLLLYECSGVRLALHGPREALCGFHLGVVALAQVLERDAYVAASAGHAGRYRLGIGDVGIDHIVDAFGVVADVW